MDATVSLRLIEPFRLARISEFSGREATWPTRRSRTFSFRGTLSAECAWATHSQSTTSSDRTLKLQLEPPPLWRPRTPSGPGVSLLDEGALVRRLSLITSQTRGDIPPRSSP